MKNLIYGWFAILLLLTSNMAKAADYTTYLTSERGFVEVTSAADLLPGTGYCYILAAAEDAGLVVGVGPFQDKPGWATAQTKALRYVAADSDPVLERSNFFYLEKEGNYIGFRNLVYSADCFQTHNGAGFMYVNTFTDKSFDEWSYLIPSFQDGYWLMENGKYPLSGGDYYSGYLGPWFNSVAAGEAIALNRKNTAGDEAGHYRIFRIAKDQFETLSRSANVQRLYAASASQPLDATWLITNPSFESGAATGWVGYPKVTNDPEVSVRGDYTMTDEEGGYLYNAYLWWASNLNISQEVASVPAGEYELSAVVATWEGRTAYLQGNNSKTEVSGQGDATGISVSVPVTVNQNRKLTVTAGSTAQWWVDGHGGETQTFFKVDDVRLICKGLYLDGYALPLPNDDHTLLVPGQWYYYEVPSTSHYLLRGNLSQLVYTDDGMSVPDQVSTQTVEQRMAFNRGKVYFKTSGSNVTLSIAPEKETREGTFTAVALNVDGLPPTILGVINVNKDGPGSDGTKLISQYLSAKQYDFIGVSEDFNYHGSLMSALGEDYASGEVRATLSISDLGIPFDTDGLNLLWKTTKVNAENETWTEWTSTTSTDGNQYIKKGFRHYDMTVDDDIVIDVYVLHMDAGNAISSREAQWQQLAGAINQADPTRPKLVIGDTNSRWTRENIKSKFFDQFTQYDVSDVWVELCRYNQYPNTTMNDLTDSSIPTNFGNYEVVDKIIYLNPKTEDAVQLVPMSFKIEQDYIYATVDGTDNDNPLGDHKPVVVEFKYLKPGENAVNIRDVNRDGSVSVADVMAVVNILLGDDQVEPYVYDHFAADANGDGIISVADAMAIVDYILTQ